MDCAEQDHGTNRAQISSKSGAIGCDWLRYVPAAEGVYGRDACRQVNRRAHFFYKRAKRLAGTHGTADEHRTRLAALTI